MKLKFKVTIVGNDIFFASHYVQASNFELATNAALKLLDSYHSRTIEQLRIKSIEEL